MHCEKFPPYAAGALCAGLSFLLAGSACAADAALDPVLVTATRQATRASDLLSDVTLLEGEAITQAGPASTVAELLARQPGLEMVRTGGPGAGTEIRIRGGSAKHTLLLIDGVRVGSATSGEAAWGRIPMAEVERIEILRGPASALYGSDALGGVVQIFTRRGDGPPRVHAEAGAGSQDTSSGSLGVAGGSNGWRYSLNTSTFRSEGFDATANPKAKFANRDRDGYTNTSTSGSLSYTPAKGHELGLTYFNSDGRNRFDSGTSATIARKDHQLETKVTSWGAYARNAVSADWTSTLRVGSSEDDQTNYRDGAIYSIFRTEQKQFGWQNDVRLPFGKALVAVERLDQKVSGSNAYRVDQRTIDSLLGGWSGQFAAHRLQFSVRRDDNSQFGGKNTGNAAYGYQLSETWRAHASYGTAYRAPTFSELYYPPTAGLSGNPDLKPEFARNRELALHYEQGSHHASATWYLNKVSDLIAWGSRPSPVNIGSATLEGLTLAYQGTLGGYDLGASADFLDPRDDATGKILSRRARERASLSLGKRVGPWEARAEMQAVGQRYDADDNLRKLAGYTLFNLYGSYAVARDWSIFARAENIFDRKYELALDYATPGASIFVGIRYVPK